ncbi:MAG: hypothetical protein Q7S07_01805, partial [Candidatus Omnitrophota bacterium]|nr:hypothetical protein [Candidatus Omnitrophota bacterium]
MVKPREYTPSFLDPLSFPRKRESLPSLRGAAKPRRSNLIFKSIAALIACAFLINDLAFAADIYNKTSPDQSTLAPYLRLKPFFTANDLDFKNIFALYCAADSLKKIAFNKEATDGDVARLNKSLLQSSNGEIGIVKDTGKDNFIETEYIGNTEKRCRYAVIEFKKAKGRPRIKVQFTDDPDKLNEDELRGLGVTEPADKEHFRGPYLNGIWFAALKPDDSGVSPIDASLKAQSRASRSGTSPDAANDAVMTKPTPAPAAPVVAANAAKETRRDALPSSIVLSADEEIIREILLILQNKALLSISIENSVNGNPFPALGTGGIPLTSDEDFLRSCCRYMMPFLRERSGGDLAQYRSFISQDNFEAENEREYLAFWSLIKPRAVSKTTGMRWLSNQGIFVESALRRKLSQLKAGADGKYQLTLYFGGISDGEEIMWALRQINELLSTADEFSHLKNNLKVQVIGGDVKTECLYAAEQKFKLSDLRSWNFEAETRLEWIDLTDIKHLQRLKNYNIDCFFLINTFYLHKVDVDTSIGIFDRFFDGSFERPSGRIIHLESDKFKYAMNAIVDNLKPGALLFVENVKETTPAAAPLTTSEPVLFSHPNLRLISAGELTGDKKNNIWTGVFAKIGLSENLTAVLESAETTVMSAPEATPAPGVSTGEAAADATAAAGDRSGIDAGTISETNSKSKLFRTLLVAIKTIYRRTKSKVYPYNAIINVDTLLAKVNKRLKKSLSVKELLTLLDSRKFDRYLEREKLDYVWLWGRHNAKDAAISVVQIAASVESAPARGVDASVRDLFRFDSEMEGIAEILNYSDSQLNSLRALSELEMKIVGAAIRGRTVGYLARKFGGSWLEKIRYAVTKLGAADLDEL